MEAIMKPSMHSREQTTTMSYTCEGQIQTTLQQRDTTARSGRSTPPKSPRRGRSSGVAPRLPSRTLRRLYNAVIKTPKFVRGTIILDVIPYIEKVQDKAESQQPTSSDGSNLRGNN
ncbi:hypothetical protein DEO72_LG3g1953 [Vigna unguiculata]|uniref:Uncharacterized protein n=1 Tax=Vigna unguiculata TaxID=3917 RepID=A0A4D6LFR4_VIGUN|nr:hypothetical protein DEO72_LG3g1953 [Vigna unguiculata]